MIAPYSPASAAEAKDFLQTCAGLGDILALAQARQNGEGSGENFHSLKMVRASSGAIAGLFAQDFSQQVWLAGNPSQELLSKVVAELARNVQGIFCEQAAYENLCRIRNERPETADSWQGDGSLCALSVNSSAFPPDTNPLPSELEANVARVATARDIALCWPGPFQAPKNGDKEFFLTQWLAQAFGRLKIQNPQLRIYVCTRPPQDEIWQSAAAELGFEPCDTSRYFRLNTKSKN